MSHLKAKILGTLRRRPVFLAGLATVSEDGSPWVRYVTGKIDDDLTIRIATSLQSKKVTHVRSCPRVHLVCGDISPEGTGPFFQIEGEAEISTDPGEKKAMWFDSLAYYFQTPESPDWCVFKVVPHRIVVHSPTSTEAEVWEPRR